MAETALIGLDVDLSLINRRLAEAGNLTAKEARHMQGELVRAFKHSARASEDAAKQIARATSKAARDAERDAKKAAREVESSVRGQASAVRGLFTAALGGVGGDLLDLADATEGASDAMAALGLAFGALTLAPQLMKSLADGLVSMADAGIEARDSLKEVGIQMDTLFTPTQLAALAAYEENLKLSELTTQAMAVELGAASAGSASFVKDVELAGTVAGGRFSENVQGATANVGHFAENLVASNALGLLFISSLRSAGREAGQFKFEVSQAAEEASRLAKENAILTKRMEDEAEMLHALGMAITDQEQKSLEAERAKRLKAAADEIAKQKVSEHAAAVRDLMSAVNDGTIAITEARHQTDGLATTNMALVPSYEAFFKGQRQLNEALGEGQGILAPDNGLSPMEKFAEDMEKASGVANLMASSITPIINNVATLASMEQRQHEDRVANLRTQRAESRETYRDALREFSENRDSMTDHERAVAEFELAQLKIDEENKRELIREREREAKQAARDGYKRTQALQIAAAVIESARNAIALTSAYVPIAGPYAPLVATGVAAAQLGTQIAIIQGTPPPKFHFGTSSSAGANQGPSGIPGAEFAATLEQGEGVVSRRGMATPGMEELVAMVNSGQAPTMQRSVSDTEADLLARRLNRPYAPSIRGRAEAGRNTFYRGR